jgi:hypothetical protein
MADNKILKIVFIVHETYTTDIKKITEIVDNFWPHTSWREITALEWNKYCFVYAQSQCSLYCNMANIIDKKT